MITTKIFPNLNLKLKFIKFKFKALLAFTIRKVTLLHNEQLRKSYPVLVNDGNVESQLCKIL